MSAPPLTARRNSIELLQELEALSESLSLSNPARRAASLVLPRSSASAGDDLLPPPAKPSAPPAAGERKGIRSWKPVRALLHLGKRRLGCLFSVKAVSAHGLPASMDGLRLSVAVRKREAKAEGAARTAPSRVLQGSAEFEETLFVNCHLYYKGKPPQFEPRLFVISAVAVDSPELDLGSTTVDLSLLVRESMERSFEGARVRQWDASLALSGKAEGGQLVVRLGFQIMEDGGFAIYSQAARQKRPDEQGMDSFLSSRRRQSESPFSIARSNETEDVDLPEEFQVVDKGVEIDLKGGEPHSSAKPEGNLDWTSSSSSSEIVKEVVGDQAHQVRLRELEAIASDLKALGSIIAGQTDTENAMPQLDAEEKTVTEEFFQLLEFEDGKQPEANKPTHGSEIKSGADGEARTGLPDLGKGLGPVVQTRDGGYLLSMNPFDLEVDREEAPKLAVQISRPFILQNQKQGKGPQVFRRLLASEKLASELLELTAMDELMGKTAEQVAFEGIASAIIGGRNKEGASSSAARSITSIKMMAAAATEGRKDRVSTGSWKLKGDPVLVEEILALSLQKLEEMAMEALKIQAGMADEEAPLDISPLIASEEDASRLLDRAILLEEWTETCVSDNSITMLVAIQLRDPLRRFEPVGGLVIALIEAAMVDGGGEDEEKRFKVTALHVGGVKQRSGEKNNYLGSEKQRANAAEWLLTYGVAKEGKKKKSNKTLKTKVGKDLVWSLSSKVTADVWLKPMRNPDVKITNQ